MYREKKTWVQHRSCDIRRRRKLIMYELATLWLSYLHQAAGKIDSHSTWLSDDRNVVNCIANG
jgi:hypothetical protein